MEKCCHGIPLSFRCGTCEAHIIKRLEEIEKFSLMYYGRFDNAVVEALDSVLSDLKKLGYDKYRKQEKPQDENKDN